MNNIPHFRSVRKGDLQPVTYPVAPKNASGIMDSQPYIVTLPCKV